MNVSDEAALILPEESLSDDIPMEVIRQEKQNYIAITIKSPMDAPFRLTGTEFITWTYISLLSNIRIV